MAINTTLTSVSTTAASNGPAGSDQRTLADDGLRQYAAFIKQLKVSAALASGNTVTPPDTANVFLVSGVTTINTIASTNSWDGRDIYFLFAGILTLTHSSNLALPGAANIVTAANDVAHFIQTGTGAWRCDNYQPAASLLSATSTDLTLTGFLSVQGNTTLGNAGTDTVTTNGNVTINAPTSGDTLVLGQIAGLTGLNLSASLSGSVVQGLISNTSNTASSNALLQHNVGGSSAGDPYSLYVITGAQAFSVGIDNSDSDTWKVDSSGALTTTTNRLNVTTDGRIYGTALHNNAADVTGTTNQYIASFSGQTPATSSPVNCTAATQTGSGKGTRVGNIVTGSLIVSVDPTVASTLTSFKFALPIAANFTSGLEVSGSAVQNLSSAAAATVGICAADTANDVIGVTFFCGTDTAARDWFINYQYEIV